MIGEDHLKIWVRLHILRDIAVSLTRVLSLMRENALGTPPLHSLHRATRLTMKDAVTLRLSIYTIRAAEPRSGQGEASTSID